MSEVLIRGMKMPKSCMECYAKRGERLDGCPKMKIENAFKRPSEFLSRNSIDKDCPLLEVYPSETMDGVKTRLIFIASEVKEE